MKINNISMYVGDNYEQKNNNVISAPLQKKNITDPLENIKNLAKKKALKVVSDAYKAEQQIDDDIKERREKIRELTSVVADNKKAILDIEDKINALAGSYNIDKDSEEYKDTQLLLKSIDSELAGSQTKLTDEEKEKLENMDMDNLTEYQKRAMELKYSEHPYATKAYDALKTIEDQNAVIRQTKIERNKSHGVADAKKQAKEIQENARKEIINTLADQGRSHVEEVMDEKVKEAKEEAKEEEERELRIDKIKAKAEETKELASEIREHRQKDTEHLIQDILESTNAGEATVDTVEDAQNKVKDMMRKMKLIEDDLKGTTVDEAL